VLFQLEQFFFACWINLGNVLVSLTYLSRDASSEEIVWRRRASMGRSG
jgi:hypothetical protein